MAATGLDGRRFSGGFGRARRAAAFLVLSVALAACESAEERAQGHFDRALALVERGDDDKAGLEFRNALRLNADFAEARFELGKLQEREGNLRAAGGHYVRAAELMPDNAEARRRAGAVFLYGGDLESAESYLQEAVRLAPQDAEALALRATLRLRQGDGAAATADAEAALAIDPANVIANTVIISRAAEDGDVAQAQALLDAQIEANPRELSYHLFKLRLLELAQDRDGVGAQLARMAELYPEQPEFRRALAQWRIQIGDTAGAEQDLRALAAVDGVEGVMRLVQFIARVRGDDAARQELRGRIESGDPDEARRMRETLAEFEIRGGRIDEGVAILQALIDEAASVESVNNARLKLALVRLAEGDREAAGALAAAVLESDAENGEALAIRAANAIEDGRTDAAIADLRIALRSEPGNVRYMLMQATAHELGGNPSAASERLAAAARVSDFAPEVALRYANFLVARGERSAAETALSESARRNPGNRALLVRLAEVRLAVGDWSGAEEVALALRRLENGGGVADRVAAEALQGQGRGEESIALLERAVEADAGGALVALLAGYVRNGQTDQAVQMVEEALAANPEDRRAQLLRAELHLITGEIDQARARLQSMIDQSPSDALGYVAMTRLNLRAGLLPQAKETALAGAAAAPDNQPIRLLLAQIRETEGDFDGAIAEYERLYEANPGSTIVANNLASLISEHRADDPAALETATLIARRLRGYEVPEFQDTVGWIQFLTGDRTGALSTLRGAAERLPDNPMVRYHLGEVYAALGERDLARTELEAALRLDPAFPRAEAAQARLAEMVPAQ